MTEDDLDDADDWAVIIEDPTDQSDIFGGDYFDFSFSLFIINCTKRFNQQDLSQK